MEMRQSKDDKFIPMTSVSSGKLREVRSDVFYYTNQIVNVVFIGTPQQWVLIDAGMPKSGEEIRLVAEDLFGAGSKPAAIILTHGHFDHVGGIVHLIKNWNVPVYAHPLEIPFLTAQQSYPEPDTSVEGGLLAKISAIYPNEPIDITPALHTLPWDSTVPFLPGWKWLPTPGHSPGQIALYRESDGTLISADAFITVKQDSMYKVLIQKKEVCGPPVYLTTDWEAAKTSVIRLQQLHPRVVIPGHGSAMEGQELTEGLQRLVNNFDEVAVPEHGKFVANK
jgi:glyoxylase-like metal-dependent hydrolase (beta-lactamase superfamily II)